MPWSAGAGASYGSLHYVFPVIPGTATPNVEQAFVEADARASYRISVATLTLAALHHQSLPADSTQNKIVVNRASITLGGKF